MKHYHFFRADSLTFSKFYSIRVVSLSLIGMSIPLDVNTSISIFLPSDSTRICYSWRTPHLTCSSYVSSPFSRIFCKYFFMIPISRSNIPPHQRTLEKFNYYLIFLILISSVGRFLLLVLSTSQLLQKSFHLY